MLKESDLEPYQVLSVDRIIDNPFYALFLDMGLGKTVSTLTAIVKLFEDLAIASVLVIAPKKVAENVWSDEIEKWEHLRHLSISKILGTEKQRRKALATEADIYIINRENTAWLCGLYGGSMLPFDMCVIDESSSFKNHQAVRFKALKMVQPSFERLVLLTGTPAPKGLIDLWPQLYLLDRGQRLGKTITQYRNEFFVPGTTKGHTVFNYNLKDKTAEQRIYNRIGDICLSMKTEDHVQLPERIDNYIQVHFDAKTREAYDRFEAEKVLEIMEGVEEGSDIAAVNAAALSNKLLQYANGAIYDEGRNVHPVHDLKLEAAEDLVESAGGKSVLIAWAYQHDRDRLLQRLKKYKPRQLSAKDSSRDIKDWNDGKIQVLLMHPASGGHGLNLQAGGSLVLWFGLNWSLELYQQLNKRLHRRGQKESVIIHHLVAEGTIDQDVIKSLARKDKGQEGLMQAVKAKIKKYEKYFL